MLTITKLEEYLDQANLEMQSVISDYALENLYQTQMSYAKSKRSKGSSEKKFS